MTPKANTREGRIRDRWIAVVAALGVVFFLSHGIHVFVSDAWLEVVAVAAVAVIVASTAMAVYWDKRAKRHEESN
jgi:uncharacterized membrane protein YbhN (UPF0104 family)